MPRPANTPESLLSRTTPTPSGMTDGSLCLIWNGAVRADGAPKATVRGESVHLRRWLYLCAHTHLRGEDVRYLKMRCGNRLCLNTAHMREAT